MGAPPQVGENGREDCMGVGYVKGTKYRWDLQLVRHKGAILGHISTPGTRELWLALWTPTRRQEIRERKPCHSGMRRIDDEKDWGRWQLGSGSCRAKVTSVV